MTTRPMPISLQSLAPIHDRLQRAASYSVPPTVRAALQDARALVESCQHSLTSGRRRKGGRFTTTQLTEWKSRRAAIMAYRETHTTAETARHFGISSSRVYAIRWEEQSGRV